MTKKKKSEFIREDLPPNDWKSMAENWNKNHPNDKLPLTKPPKRPKKKK